MYELKSICSNPECNYSFTHKMAEPFEKFCTKCGSKMLDKCPKCGKEFNSNTELYCSECGALIKSK